MPSVCRCVLVQFFLGRGFFNTLVIHSCLTSDLLSVNDLHVQHLSVQLVVPLGSLIRAFSEQASRAAP